VKYSGLAKDIMARAGNDHPSSDTHHFPIIKTLVTENLEFKSIEIPMTALERSQVRRKVITSDGFVLALALPTGTVLMPRDVLYCNAQTRKNYVVSARAEDLLIAKPHNLQHALKIAHAIGNLHRDIDIQDNGNLHLLYEPHLELLMLRMQCPLERSSGVFLGKPSWEHTV
jgi:urease accessory protein